MSKNQEIKPGSEVLSVCGKCKLTLAHVVIAMKKNGSIGKCECNTCGAVHLYRDPDKPKKTRTTKTRISKEESAALAWNTALAEASASSKPYAMTSEFAIGDLIQHPTFGKGIVQELINHNKIKIVFESGEKILIHTRS